MTMKAANIPTAIKATIPIVCRGIRPTELAEPDKISRGLNTFTIILDIWALVCSSIIPVLDTKKPVPIIIKSASIWKNIVKIVIAAASFS